jgi:hypothetical protein
VWRDYLLAEEARLNARLAELDATPPSELDARLEETRDEVSGRLAEVHTSLADMEAESGPARAAALLAGWLWIPFIIKEKSSNFYQVLDSVRKTKGGQQSPSLEAGGAWSLSLDPPPN